MTGTTLTRHKTKIVATIGPASDSPEMLVRLIQAGLDIARLNFSHGDFSGHAERVARTRVSQQRVDVLLERQRRDYGRSAGTQDAARHDRPGTDRARAR